MDNQTVKTEIKEKLGVDKIIDEQLEWKGSDAIGELDEKDIEKIKRKLRAEVEQELDERLDREIEEQLERKRQEQERRAQLEKSLKKARSVIAGGVAVFCSAMLAIGVIKLFFSKNGR